MTAIVTRGDAGNLHLPDETVDLIVTSPPYFGLRSYQDGGEHYAGQVGDEATPTEYLDALMACTAEWMRVLKPGGSIFVNLGDKYAQPGKGERTRHGSSSQVRHKHQVARNVSAVGRSYGDIPGKSLMMLPQRYAIRCIDELGLILRAEIVWAKPNGLPESVTDRVRRSHEQVFHFVKQPRYFSAVDEVREQYSPASLAAYKRGGLRSSIGDGTHPSKQNVQRLDGEQLDTWTGNPLGKLPGSVWEIPTAPLKVPASLGIDHFAAYPPELVRRIVLGWSPREVCTACGEGRRPVSQALSVVPKPFAARQHERSPLSGGTRSQGLGYSAADRARTITGYVCGCPEFSESFPKPESTPGVVLDPFGGTGTTALVADVHGRTGISVDLSADYCRLAQWRTTDPGERARVLGVEKPPVQVDGQLGMFEGIGA